MSRAITLGARASSSSAATRSTKKSATQASSVAATLGVGSPSNILPAAAASKRKKATSNDAAPARKKAKGASEGTSSTGPNRDGRLPTTRAPKAPKIPKEKPEKRLARYIASPSIATTDRITRAFQHRLYLIDKRLSGDPDSPTSCTFNVLGSTGNVYEVKLEQKPHCSCPDFPRSGLCKHVLFVMLRVLKLDRNDPRVWQKALLTTELRELLDISAVSDGVLASQSVRQRFQDIQGAGKSREEDAGPKPHQREISGDCPICYESMDDGRGKAKEPVVFCRSCGNNVHKDCFEKWDRSKNSSGGQTTCIYCRAVWSEDSAKKTGKMDYVNLADVSEPHRNHHASLEDLYPASFQWFGYHGRRGRGGGRRSGRGVGR